MRAPGGTVVSTSETNQSLLARLPLEKVEELAGLQDVRFVQPAAQDVTH